MQHVIRAVETKILAEGVENLNNFTSIIFQKAFSAEGAELQNALKVLVTENGEVTSKFLAKGLTEQHMIQMATEQLKDSPEILNQAIATITGSGM